LIISFRPYLENLFQKGTKIVSKVLRVFYVKVAPKKQFGLQVFRAQRQKKFPFPLVIFVQVLSYSHGLKGFIKRSNVDYSKSSVAIVLGDNVSLDFITFTVPKEVKKEVIYLFYNLRINLIRRQKMNYLGDNQTLNNWYFPDKA